MGNKYMSLCLRVKLIMQTSCRAIKAMKSYHCIVHLGRREENSQLVEVTSRANTMLQKVGMFAYPISADIPSWACGE